MRDLQVYVRWTDGAVTPAVLRAINGVDHVVVTMHGSELSMPLLASGLEVVERPPEPDAAPAGERVKVLKRFRSDVFVPGPLRPEDPLPAFWAAHVDGTPENIERNKDRHRQRVNARGEALEECDLTLRCKGEDATLLWLDAEIAKLTELYAADWDGKLGFYKPGESK